MSPLTRPDALNLLMALPLGEPVPGRASRADLTGAVLESAHLADRNLKGARLVGAVLCEADLSNADLTGAVLRAACLCGADLRGANLAGADLSGACLERVWVSP